MKHIWTKAGICAIAAAIFFTGSGVQSFAANAVMGSLPAAGLGLTMNDGASVAAIRNEITAVVTDTDIAYVDNSNLNVSDLEIVWAVEPRVKENKTKLTEEQTEEPDLIIAQVNSHVNIRNTPSTEGEIVGKLYDNSVGTLIAQVDDWYQIKSGNVEGYVKAEYFKVGAEAKQIADEVGNKIATVTAETLRVRTEPSLEATILGLIPRGDQLSVLDTADGFVKVSIEEGDGWVSADYVDVAVEYVTAESKEEEAARLAAEAQAREESRRAAEAAEAKLREKEAAKAAEKAAQQAATQSASAITAASSSLGQAVASFALQFVGNPYVYGGTSLTNGADCSGFVMSVYKNFGVSLPHSSYSDRYVGYAVGSMAEAQPGDIICYSGHVAIYIGNGQIVHASTKKTGIKVSDASYRKPLAIRRIF
ncbi:MAG: SH3 domain-containing protein [Lachnospiraceae bacterium]|nr:SH3 domain-containing protein [Lachnospiraceae bacterium]